MLATTTTTEHPVTRPEYFRLPRPGKADQFFGFSRSWFYAAEKRGWLKLIRIRDEGRSRGVTLASFTEVQAFVQSQAEREKEPAQ
jgi:hypothetical protein